MSALQVYVYASTALFVLFGVMLSGGNVVGLLLKSLSWVMVLFGFAVSLAVSGVVLSNGIRLI